MTKQRLAWVVAGLALVATSAILVAFAPEHTGLAALLAPGGVAMALTIPPTFAARGDTDQRLHYIRLRFRVQDVAKFAPGAKICRLPARAWIHSIKWHKSVAFNSTTDLFQLGSTQTGVDILAATSIQGTGYVDHTAAAGLGIVVGTTGEVDLWGRYTLTGGPATTGDMTLVIAYIPDGDQ